MGFLIGLLTFVMVLDCFVLILLVLMQLPKKDAGAGLAFGGGATDALFGAGSGNVLTKATKYAAIIFFVLAILTGTLQSRYHHRSVSELEKALASQSETQPATPPASPTASVPPATNFTLETTTPVEPAPAANTNAPAAQ